MKKFFGIAGDILFVVFLLPVLLVSKLIYESYQVWHFKKYFAEPLRKSGPQVKKESRAEALRRYDDYMEALRLATEEPVEGHTDGNKDGDNA